MYICILRSCPGGAASTGSLDKLLPSLGLPASEETWCFRGGPRCACCSCAQLLRTS